MTSWIVFANVRFPIAALSLWFWFKKYISIYIYIYIFFFFCCENWFKKLSSQSPTHPTSYFISSQKKKNTYFINFSKWRNWKFWLRRAQIMHPTKIFNFASCLPKKLIILLRSKLILQLVGNNIIIK